MKYILITLLEKFITNIFVRTNVWAYNRPRLKKVTNMSNSVADISDKTPHISRVKYYNLIS